MTRNVKQAVEALFAFALAFPEAWEDHPWGESVIKVKKKVFVFLGREAERAEHVALTVKLPESGPDVLFMPFAQPTGYGLGKSGWVTMKFEPGKHPPLERMYDWIEESYRAVAPKTLVKAIDETPVVPPAARKKKASRKKAATRKKPAATRKKR